MIKAIYPGSFNPPTEGHLSIINAAAMMFEDVTVAIGNNLIKKEFICLDHRVRLLKECDLPQNIKIDTFTGLLADYCKEHDIKVIIRGVRSMTDFEYELNMVHVNYDINNKLQTIFIPANLNLSMVSSSIIREVYQITKKIPKQFEAYVPLPVRNYLNKEV